MSRKITKSDARYQPYPKGLKKCSGCTMFVRPDDCTLVVKGVDGIKPFGYCIHHEARK
jgi:hypothetical protein